MLQPLASGIEVIKTLTSAYEVWLVSNFSVLSYDIILIILSDTATPI